MRNQPYGVPGTGAGTVRGYADMPHESMPHEPMPRARGGTREFDRVGRLGTHYFPHSTPSRRHAAWC